MKLIEERNFPYPILLDNGGDFNNASFQVECKLRISDDKKSIILIFNYEIKCDFINNLIENGLILPLVNVSQRTYRKTGSLINGNEMSIPMDWLSPNHNLEIMPMLVAKQDYSFGYDESMDSSFSYFDEDFSIKRGQIVGYGNFISVALPTNTKLGSIFTISKLKDKDEIAKGNPYIVSFNTPAIDIKVLPEIYDSFFDLTKKDSSYRKLLYSTFVYPTVQLAIMMILQDYESVKDYKWCIAITNKISKAKSITFGVETSYSKDDIAEYTNVVLDTLLQDAFRDISNGGEF